MFQTYSTEPSDIYILKKREYRNVFPPSLKAVKYIEEFGGSPNKALPSILTKPL